jgi:Putative Tad-like Flp pilus-assembly
LIAAFIRLDLIDLFPPGRFSMSGIGATGRSLSVGRAGISLVLVGVGFLALYQFVVTTVDVQLVAAAQADAQATANAAAAGSIADLSNGAVAVIRTAGQIISSRKSVSDAARLGDAEIQIGHWDPADRSFSTGPGKPNAIRTTVRVRKQLSMLGMVFGGSGQQIEAQAIAIDKSAGKTLVATKGITTAN